jgi:short-subunit dehydrogenase
MISVAGMQGMTAMNNTDYSASKAALTAFFDSLRQELIDEGSPVKITNVYPYIIDTDLFKGFSGFALKIIPILKKQSVAYRIYEAIMFEEQEVYIPGYTYWMGVGMMIIRGFSEPLRIRIIQKLMGDGMKTLKG